MSSMILPLNDSMFCIISFLRLLFTYDRYVTNAGRSEELILKEFLFIQDDIDVNININILLERFVRYIDRTYL